MARKSDGALVRVYPDPHHFAEGESASERDVTPEEAERLTSLGTEFSRAFHLTPQVPVHVTEAPPDDPPAEADQPEGPADAGPVDSAEV